MTTMVTGLAALGAGTATAQDADPWGCREAPAPTGPTSGPAGSLNPGIAEGVPAGGALDGIDPLGTYGYGGLEWSTYDLGCGGNIRDPAALIDTMFGNMFLGTGKILFAAEQGLKDLAASIDATDTVAEAARESADPVREAIFSPWAGAALVVAATVMLIASQRGDIGEVMTRAGAILAAITVVALSFGSGAQLSNDLSGVIRTAIDDAMQKTAQVAFPSGNLSGEEDPSYGMRNVIYRELLWKAWKDGEVGVNGDEQRAWQLFEQQALNRAEEQQVNEGSGGEDLIEEKDEQWRTIADDAPPMEYRSIQGRGDSRTAAGLFALAKIAPVSLLQIFASLVQYVMYVFLALIPVGAPLVALLAIMRPNTTEKSVKVVGSVILGGLVAAVAAIVHAIIVMFMAQGELGSWGAILVVWVATAVLFKIMKPVVSLVGIIESVRGQAGSIGSRVGRAGSWIKGERRFRAGVRVDAERHQELVGALSRRVVPGRGGLRPGPDEGGGPNRPDGGGPNRPDGGGPNRPDGGGPNRPDGGGPNRPDGGGPNRPDGGGPNRPDGGGPNRPDGGGRGSGTGKPDERKEKGRSGGDPSPTGHRSTRGETGPSGRSRGPSPRGEQTAARAVGNPAVTVARRAASARNVGGARGAGVGAYRPTGAGRRPHRPGTPVGAAPTTGAVAHNRRPR
ncbi:hypothetical protein [Pseudonocardia sp. ICBG1142]|uniref:hypothetical protein n=1 Tax=Pseudonocardia sp. ICBG1142 TaxID=2846760 RepID=UPI00210710E0|nr:hypothetical protein [Pseudonocardia sp. ICBG1142]